MYEKGYGGPTSSDSEHRIQIEIQQLREDNRALRERNYKLHEESMQLREELMKFKEEGQRGLPPRDVRASPRDTRSPLDVRTISPREVRTPHHSRGYSLGKSLRIHCMMIISIYVKLNKNMKFAYFLILIILYLYVYVNVLGKRLVQAVPIAQFYYVCIKLQERISILAPRK